MAAQQRPVDPALRARLAERHEVLDGERTDVVDVLELILAQREPRSCTRTRIAS